MSVLVTYLQDNHQSPENVAQDFLEKFGVNARSEGDLHLFKYHQFEANWQEPLTHHCRGHIVRFSDNGWKAMSRPFDKFFNQGEGHCPVFKKEEFDRRLPNMTLVEKADGTCLQLWHDGERWRVSTLGTITTSNVAEESYTFEDLFWRTISLKPENLSLDPDWTILLELCCDENRIVTKYEQNHAVVLAIRNRKTGKYELKLEDVNQASFGLVLAIQSVHSGESIALRLPQFVRPADRGLTSLEDVIAFVEEESTKAEEYGEYAEGFVAYENGRPIAKFKNERYMSLHHVGGGDIGHSKNKIVDAFFLGHFDDVYPVLSDRLRAFADNLVTVYEEELERVKELGTRVGSEKFESRKEYALFIKGSGISKTIEGFFFENINDFSAGIVGDIATRFAEWIRAIDKKKRHRYLGIGWKAMIDETKPAAEA